MSVNPSPDKPIPLDLHALDGYGKPSGLGDRSTPRKGCLIDLGDITLRAGAVATGLIWSGPMSAQERAVRDIASGRIERPTYEMPDWAENSLAYYLEHGIGPEAVQ